MPQSFAQVFAQLVFSTRDRRPLFQDRAIREEMHRFLGGTCNRLECPVLLVGGVEDHVHVLCCLGRTVSIADLVRELKRESSEWIKTKSAELGAFYWQRGYGAFSVSPGHVATLKEYIANQEEHHRTESFQDEYRRLLTKYAIEWDERYVWD